MITMNLMDGKLDVTKWSHGKMQLADGLNGVKIMLKTPNEMNLQNLISTAQVGAKTSSSSEFIVNEILTKLKKGRTAWRTSFKSQLEVDGYKEDLLLACQENGINTMEQVNRGLARTRQTPSPFLPDVGTFISWCKPEPRHFEHLAIEKADMVFDENQKRLANKPINKDVGREALRKMLEGK